MVVGGVRCVCVVGIVLAFLFARSRLVCGLSGGARCVCALCIVSAYRFARSRSVCFIFAVLLAMPLLFHLMNY